MKIQGLTNNVRGPFLVLRQLAVAAFAPFITLKFVFTIQ
jgi:hypothetical protein